MRIEHLPSPIFVCAGEPSGDLYAALYVQQAKKSHPGQHWFGVGGPQMSATGVDIVFTYEKLEKLGFKAAFGALSDHVIALRKIKKAISRIRPRTFIAVAYPGMNFLLIKYARSLGCRVIYLLPPQAWAWGAFRVNLVARWVDKVISVFPFEYEYYRHRGIPVEYWENPLVGVLRYYVRTDNAPRIGFMPGSRCSEINRNLPVIMEFITYLQMQEKSVRFAIILHTYDMIGHNPRITRTLHYLKQQLPERLTVFFKDRYTVMKNCDLLVTCSGTASLEAAFMGIQQVFFNRCSWFDYVLLRPLLSIREYNLANLHFGKSLVPSCVHYSDHRLLSFLKHIDIEKYIN
jgi:lipid-A-disaccharide synthase